MPSLRAPRRYCRPGRTQGNTPKYITQAPGGARPRSQFRGNQFGLCPRFGLRPDISGQGRTRGIAPKYITKATGGAELRLTSGGEAAAYSDMLLHVQSRANQIRVM